MYLPSLCEIFCSFIKEMDLYFIPILTCGKRSKGLELGPPEGTARGCVACVERFTVCPLAGSWATGGTSACSGIPWIQNHPQILDVLTDCSWERNVMYISKSRNNFFFFLKQKPHDFWYPLQCYQSFFMLRGKEMQLLEYWQCSWCHVKTSKIVKWNSQNRDNQWLSQDYYMQLVEHV